MTRPGHKVSPLEMAVLGIVWKREPCTAYSVMRGFAGSTTDFFRSKIGTVYPLVARLVAAGLLAYAAEERGAKGDRLLTITPAGLERVRSWLTSPVPRDEISHTVDLVRLRAGYLGTLEPEERTRFIDDSLDGLRDHLHRCHTRAAQYVEAGDHFGAIGVRETIYETQARIAWLEESRQALLDLPAGKPAQPEKMP